MNKKVIKDYEKIMKLLNLNLYDAISYNLFFLLSIP